MRAKTKLNRVFYLLAILGVVFAFSIGGTFATVAFSLDTGSNLLSTTSYLAKQEHVVINDSVDTPIAFGLGSRLSEVSIQYSYSYNFDIRIQYSLSWSNGKSTDNVILRFADRDSFIVDNDYIYYKDSINAGSGNLKIITGVDFTDPTDQDYAGASLTININTTTGVKIYKEQPSYAINSHVLTSDIQASEAARAWIWYKNRTSKEKAYAIVYNLRSTYENGVEHPSSSGAYSRTNYDVDNYVTSAKWLGGNRSYGGMGVYLITGSNAYTLKIKVTGAWKTQEGNTLYDDSSDTGSAYILINNIKFNYTQEFHNAKKSDDHVFDECEYIYSVPANSTAYIELVDGVEITCAADLTQANYSGYRVLTNIYLNDTAFLSGSGTDAIYFVDGIASIDGLSNAGLSKTSYSNKSNVSVYNTTKFNPALYNYHDAIKGSLTSQSFYGNAMIVNNSADTVSVNVSYSLRAFISNGSNILFKNQGDDYTYGNNFNDTYWYRQELDVSGLTVVGSVSSVTIAPYSSVNVLEEFSLSIASAIASYNNSDAWVEVIVNVGTPNIVSTAVDDLSIEIGIKGSNYVLTLKNNTNATLTNVSGTVLITARAATFTAVDNKPADWYSNFWEYYTESGNFDSNLKTRTEWSTTTTFYSVSYSSATVKLSSGTANSGFTFTDTGFTTSSTFNISPGESMVMGTIAKLNKTEFIFNATASATSANTNGTIALLFNGTDNAYIYNNTENTYYVKFNGSMVNSLEHISTINSENYYVGVVRPGQIVKTPMSTRATTFITAVAGDTYSLPSGWADTNNKDVDNMYKDYFGR